MNRRAFARQLVKTGLIFVPICGSRLMAQVGPGRVVAPQFGTQVEHPGGTGGCTGATKDAQNGTTNNFADNVSYKWIGFNFTAGSSYNLCQVRLRLSRILTPGGQINVAVYTQNANEPGTQIGPNSSGVGAASLPTVEGNVDFNGLSASLTNGVDYWIVAKCSANGGGGAAVRLYYSFDGVATHFVKLNDGAGGTWDFWTDSNQGKFTSFS